MERIEDKQNSDMYDKMIETRRGNIEKLKKEINEIVNISWHFFYKDFFLVTFLPWRSRSETTEERSDEVVL